MDKTFDLGANLDLLKKNRHIPEVSQLITHYYAKKKDNNSSSKPPKFPLIVLEGLDGCGKTNFSYSFAKENGCFRWGCPPKSIRHLREFFTTHMEFTLPYYILGNYIAGNEIANLLQKKPVILDRYWYSTVVTPAAQKYIQENKTLFSDATFSVWPKYLLRPTNIIFMDIDEELRLKRKSCCTKPVTKEEKLLTENSDYRNYVVYLYKKKFPNVTVLNVEDPEFNEKAKAILNAAISSR